MSIRLQLLLFGVIGNLLVAAIFIFSFAYREDIQEESSNESLLTLYESAWYQTYNKSYDVMSKWLPVTGANASFWDPDSEIFLDEVDSSFVERTWTGVTLMFGGGVRDFSVLRPNFVFSHSMILSTPLLSPLRLPPKCSVISLQRSGAWLKAWARTRSAWMLSAVPAWVARVDHLSSAEM